MNGQSPTRRRRTACHVKLSPEIRYEILLTSGSSRRPGSCAQEQEGGGGPP